MAWSDCAFWLGNIAVVCLLGRLFPYAFRRFFSLFVEKLLKQLLNKGKQLAVLFFQQSMQKHIHLPFCELSGKEVKAMLNIWGMMKQGELHSDFLYQLHNSFITLTVFSWGYCRVLTWTVVEMEAPRWVVCVVLLQRPLLLLRVVNASLFLLRKPVQF